MSEHELRQAFRELTAAVRPSVNGYEVVVRRHNRWRRARMSAMALAGVLLVVAAWPVLGRLQPMPSSPDGPIFRPPGDNGPMTRWVRALIDTPTRGSLAGDSGFLSEVMAQHNVPFGDRVKVLFAGDVGDFRIVLTVYYDSDSQVAIERVAPRGTPARDLGQAFSSFPLTPYTSGVTVSQFAMWPAIATLGLAPQGCVAETAKGQEQWQAGPDPSLVVHEGDPNGLRTRVTCSGVVRYQGPLINSPKISVVDMFEPTGLQVLRAREGARGSVPEQAARELLGECSPSNSWKILFGGTVSGAPDPVYVGWCRLLDGRWEIRSRGHPLSTVAGLPAEADLTAPDAIVASPSSHGLVVIAPPAASKVDLLDPAGTVIASAPLRDGVGALPNMSKGTLRATDANGRVVGSGTTPIEWRAPQWSSIPVTVDKWD